MKIDLSTPELTRLAVERAKNNKAALRSLLFALEACRRGRARYAGQTLLQAWQTANAEDLYWLISHLRMRLYPDGDYTARMGVLDRLGMIARQIHPRAGYEPTRAKLFRAWFKPSGELRQEWNIR